MINENKIRILYEVTSLILNAFFFFVTAIHLKNIPEHHFIWEIVILIVFVIWLLHCYSYGIRWVIKGNKGKHKNKEENKEEGKDIEV